MPRWAIAAPGLPVAPDLWTPTRPSKDPFIISVRCDARWANSAPAFRHERVLHPAPRRPPLPVVTMSYALGQTLVLAAIGLSLWLTGCALEPIAVGRQLPLSGRTLGRLILGAGGWVVVAFALAATGLLKPQVVLGVLAVSTTLGALQWWRGRSPDAPALDLRITLGGTVVLVLLAAILVPAFLLAIGPTVTWDADAYHLTLPKNYVANGGFMPQPMLVYGHWPHAVELLFAVAMTVGSYVTAKLVHVFFGLAVIFTTAVAARRAAGPAAGGLAAALVLANGVVFFELRTAYVDLAYAFFLLAAVLLLHEARKASDPRRHRQYLLLAGVAAGLMASVKITGVVGAAAAAVLYVPVLLQARRGGEGAAPLRLFLLRYVTPVLALWCPWLVKAALETGNPVSPLAWSVWGGPNWSAAIGEQFSAWQRSIGMGRTLVDYLLLPYRVIAEGGRGYDHFDGQISILWLALVPLALLGIRRRPLVRRMLAVAGVYFVCWALSSQQTRFLIPVLPLLAIAAAVTLMDLLERMRKPLGATLAATAVAVVLLVTATTHARTMVAGYERLALYQQRDPASLRAAAVPEVYRWLDEHTPAQARILMLNTNAGFFCPRDYIADSFFEASQIADWLGDADSVLDLRQRLRNAGVTHVLWSAKEWRIAWPPALTQMLGNRTWAEPVFRDDRGHTVLRLH